MDESETGSANFFGPERIASVEMHLRAPSVDKGVQAGLWGLGLGVLIWLGLLAIGVGGGTALIMSALAGGAIFLYVRIYGEDEPVRTRRSRARTR